jgi:hypothetical protein
MVMFNLQVVPYKARRMLRNAFLDLRYGALLRGVRKSPFAHLGINDTANTDYAALPLIFKDLIRDSDVLVDIGCGRGRVFNWWLSRGLHNRMIGIEMDQDVAEITRRRLRRFDNVKIISGDALAQLPEEGTIFYLCNSFQRSWVEALKDRLASLFASGDGRTLVYYNCRHVDVFEQDPGWHVERIVLDRSLDPEGRFNHPVAWISMKPTVEATS